MGSYREHTIDLSTEGRKELPAAEFDAYAAAFRQTSSRIAAIDPVAPVWIRLGAEEADRINLIAKPVWRGGCGAFGVVVLEWEASADTTLELTLGSALDIGVRV